MSKHKLRRSKSNVFTVIKDWFLIRRTRLVAITFISFITVVISAVLAPGALLNRFFSTILCSVLSFNTLFCPASLAQLSQRTLAATPSTIEVAFTNQLSDTLAQLPNQHDHCGTGYVSQMEDKQGYDGTIYRGYLDFRRGRETINPAACGREYWISPNPKHPNYGVRFAYLVDGRGQRITQTLYYEAADGSVRLFRDAVEAKLSNPFAPDLGLSNSNQTPNSSVQSASTTQVQSSNAIQRTDKGMIVNTTFGCQLETKTTGSGFEINYIAKDKESCGKSFTTRLNHSGNQVEIFYAAKEKLILQKLTETRIKIIYTDVNGKVSTGEIEQQKVRQQFNSKIHDFDSVDVAFSGVKGSSKKSKETVCSQLKDVCDNVIEPWSQTISVLQLAALPTTLLGVGVPLEAALSGADMALSMTKAFTCFPAFGGDPPIPFGGALKNVGQAFRARAVSKLANGGFHYSRVAGKLGRFFENAGNLSNSSALPNANDVAKNYQKLVGGQEDWTDQARKSMGINTLCETKWLMKSHSFHENLNNGHCTKTGPKTIFIYQQGNKLNGETQGYSEINGSTRIFKTSFEGVITETGLVQMEAKSEVPTLYFKGVVEKGTGNIHGTVERSSCRSGEFKGQFSMTKQQ